ncbi:toprim domain-containing protein [Thalassotalea ponticola]|uniref:toprim domain-containing protein n=1 Tax=Thalassotalea ponticola TaxID=1523392 RepID=UPI0025B34F03|nr:toprim domain-containing protein [Thalassotalea ponticola]MDN3651349.1 toprim domain-containing protein [Thalassotalea ponticola]
MYTALDIIRIHQHEFIMASNQVGIDGSELLSNMPPPGAMLKGNSVPVLESKYRGTCSVLFYINRTRSGQEYPYVQFRTFKHGGIVSEFNGFTYLNSDTSGTEKISHQYSKVVRINQKHNTTTRYQEDKAKLQRYHSIQKQYYAAKPIDIKHPWLARRLNGYATTSLLLRTDIRSTGNGDLYVPLQNATHGHVGYHKIFSKNQQDYKRHLILKSGCLNGSYVEIRGKTASQHSVAICEGLITGLSIALVWHGPIYVALTANNLAHVRKSLNGQPSTNVYLFTDNDQWKPNVGNVGVLKARQAMLSGDHIVIPQFSSTSLLHKPTDFNDLLLLEGLKQLVKQVPTL